jgi:hypothetical protein
MTDSLQLYSTLLAAFCTHIPSPIFGDVRRLMVLAWAVVGLCLTKTVNFNQWGEVVISCAHYASSHQRRFERWFHNSHIKPIKFFFPLLRAAMQIWPPEQMLYLALDASDLRNGYLLIRLVLIYRGRAIPLTWRVLKHNSTSVSYKDYKVLLKQALLILPAGQPLILLADRGFVHAKLVKFGRQHHWGYRLRAKSSTRVRLPDRSVARMDQLCPPQGHAHFYQNVYILGETIGPVHLALAHPEAEEEPWYIISDAPSDVTTLDEYTLRFDIEIVFTQMTKASVRTGFGGRNDVVDFNMGVIDNHPVNQQFNQLSFLSKGGLVQALLDSLTESFNGWGDRSNLKLFMELCF